MSKSKIKSGFSIFNNRLRDWTEGINNLPVIVEDINISDEVQDKILPEFNGFTIVPHEGDINGLYHTHSIYSDGRSTLNSMMKEALLLGIDYLGILDHIDVTGISNKEHQTEDLGDFNENIWCRKKAIKEYIADTEESYGYVGLSVSEGAEVDWDPRNTSVLSSFVEEAPLDYYIISVHHGPEGNNLGHLDTYKGDTREIIDYYIDESLNALEFIENHDKTVTLAHPGRLETNDSLEDEITKEDYYRIIRTASELDIPLEFNLKVNLRNQLAGNGFTKFFQALKDYEHELPPICMGTDTHRVGKSPKVDYKRTETQKRLDYGEGIIGILEEERNDFELVNILEDVDSRPIRLAPDSQYMKEEDYVIA